MMTSSFECLYFLDNDQFCIVEIKVTDLLDDTQGNNRLKWLMINKNTMAVKPLHFQSMDFSHENQLENTANEEMLNEIMEAITRYLNGDGIIFL